MLKFNKLNLNPKNRKTGDCSTRALARCLDISWEEALKLQYEESLKTKYDLTSRQVIEAVLNKYGYVKVKQPRKSDNTKYRINELDEVISSAFRKTKVVANVANHYVVVEEDVYTDSWDSGKKAVGNYYVKL